MYLGCDLSANSHLIATPEGVKSARALARRPDAARWRRDLVEAVAVTPWQMGDARPAEVRFVDPADPVPAPEVREEPRVRLLRINRADLDAFGLTEGCPQCDHVAQHGPTRLGTAHSDRCRSRIMAELSKTAAGRARIEGHEEVINERLAQRVEAADLSLIHI